jgi:hypothetical protein
VTEQRYFIFETQKSSEDGLTLLMDGEPVLAEDREQAVRQFIREDGDLDPSEISKAEIMEEQHYLAIPADEVRESFYGHSEKTAVHEVWGI